MSYVGPDKTHLFDRCGAFVDDLEDTLDKAA